MSSKCLASTVGAAALAGSWANKGVQETLDRQRSAEIQDQRRVAYADFTHAAGQVRNALASPAPTSDKVNAASVDVLTQESRVLLIASEGLRRPTKDLRKYLLTKAVAGQPVHHGRLHQVPERLHHRSPAGPRQLSARLRPLREQ